MNGTSPKEANLAPIGDSDGRMLRINAIIDPSIRKFRGIFPQCLRNYSPESCKKTERRGFAFTSRSGRRQAPSRTQRGGRNRWVQSSGNERAGRPQNMQSVGTPSGTAIAAFAMNDTICRNRIGRKSECSKSPAGKDKNNIYNIFNAFLNKKTHSIDTTRHNFNYFCRGTHT